MNASTYETRLWISPRSRRDWGEIEAWPRRDRGEEFLLISRSFQGRCEDLAPLDPSNHVPGNLDPGAKFWVQGSFGPNYTQQYGSLWTCLDPSNHFKGDLEPAARFWVQGPFGFKFKSLPFSHNVGVYRLTWAPTIISKLIWTLGPNFGSGGSLAPNKKNAIWVIGPQLVSLTTWHYGPIHQKDEMPFLAKIFCPDGKNLAWKFALRPK